VSLPDPSPGLVIRYAYLWHSEYIQGREEGVKDRPCAIVLAVDPDDVSEDDQRPLVVVVPITHTPPNSRELAIELPSRVKQHLCLDTSPSWVIVSESNVFRWPGPDLRPVPGLDPSSIVYGFLPPNLFNEIKRRFVTLEKVSRTGGVLRSE
jgi:hypothetical protein